jgi:hypothetical protein
MDESTNTRLRHQHKNNRLIRSEGPIIPEDNPKANRSSK